MIHKPDLSAFGIKIEEYNGDKEYWKLVEARHADPNREFGGDHHVYIDFKDKEGRKLRGERVVFSSQSSDTTVLLDKSPNEPGANYPIWRDNLVNIQADGESDRVVGVNAIYPSYKGGDWHHHSWYFVFQKTAPTHSVGPNTDQEKQPEKPIEPPRPEVQENSGPVSLRPYHGIHDPHPSELHEGNPGWCVVSISTKNEQPIHHIPEIKRMTDAGIEVIVRLNYGYEPDGTIPIKSLYDDFARQCAAWVNAIPGVTRWIIGNEMNLSVERPGTTPITPGDYVECLKKCYSAIKSLPRGGKHEIIIGAVGPWNIQTGDWLEYFRAILTLGRGSYDGISIHTYGRQPGATDATDNSKMENMRDRYFSFRAYRDFMNNIPDFARKLPVYLTETNYDGEWEDWNSGWMNAAIWEIHRWNQVPGSQKIYCVVFYRWLKYDRYHIDGKPNVIKEFRDVARSALRPTIMVEEKEEEVKKGADLLWPCEGRITQRFVGNYGWYPFSKIGHNGTDVGAVVGTPIWSPVDGVVAWVGFDVGWGYYIRVWHPEFRFHSFMAHMNRSSELSIGDRVRRGDVLGYVGNTGRSTGPHLHYSVRIADRDGRYITSPDNPRGYVDPELFHSWLNSP